MALSRSWFVYLDHRDAALRHRCGVALCRRNAHCRYLVEHELIVHSFGASICSCLFLSGATRRVRVSDDGYGRRGILKKAVCGLSDKGFRRIVERRLASFRELNRPGLGLLRLLRL